MKPSPISKWRVAMKAALHVCLVTFAVLGTHAGVVCEQPHTVTGTLRMSSRYQPNGTDSDQFARDSFSVPTAQAVTEIRWRGGYDPQMLYWGGDILSFRGVHLRIRTGAFPAVSRS